MSIGKALAAARTAAGMTVEQVSESTRVRQTLVRQIEADDFSNCGGDFYARGHIRSIANAVGTDPAPLVAEFDAQRQGNQAPRAAQVFEPEAVPAERRGPNWGAAMAVALGVVCIWALVQVFTPADEPREAKPLARQTPAPATSAAPTTAVPGPSGPSATPSPGSDAVAAVPRNSVTVRVVCISGVSWVRATGTGRKQLFEGNLRRGQARDFTDKKVVRLIIGNAGAVRLIVNGKDLGSPGKDGQVIGAGDGLEFGPADPVAAG